jgi:phosphoglucosamine mutase
MKYFGTDGIRGIVGADFNADLIKRTAYSILRSGCLKRTKPRIIIGHDTRQSCDFVVTILTDIFTQGGAEITLAGIIPTAALAFVTREEKFDLGIMVTASHNPPQYNGIKLFATDGRKHDEETLKKIEYFMDSALSADPEQTSAVKIPADITSIWRNYLISKFQGVFQNKDKPRVSLDCANGVGYFSAVSVLESLGFNVTAYNTVYNGVNANAGCGAVYPEYLKKILKDGSVGFAFDGDADRCAVIDESGEIVKPDILLALLAYRLKVDTLVTTFMFNTGTQKWLEERGIKVVRTFVGEKHIIAALKSPDLSNQKAIGGETSAHIVFPDIFTASDGLVTALVILKVIIESGKTMCELRESVDFWPSVLYNTELLIDEGENWINGCRVYIRQSGTEKLTRILVEGKSALDCKKVLKEILKKSTRQRRVDDCR